MLTVVIARFAILPQICLITATYWSGRSTTVYFGSSARGTVSKQILHLLCKWGHDGQEKNIEGSKVKVTNRSILAIFRLSS